eukprot:scaffold100756_cov32-Prasinocladus_malaysianus.AAC.2
MSTADQGSESSHNKQGSLLSYGFKRDRPPLAERRDAVAVNNAIIPSSEPALAPAKPPVAKTSFFNDCKNKPTISVAAEARKEAARQERLRLAWERKDAKRKELELKKRQSNGIATRLSASVQLYGDAEAIEPYG